MRFGTAAIVALTGVMAAASVAKAQTVQQIEALSFGTFVVTSNATPSTLTVPLNGSTTTNGTIVALTQGTKGQYRIGGLPGNSIVGIDITAQPLFGATAPASQYFNITGFSHPLTVTTNSGGMATFALGATLSTSGTAVPYTDNTYTGTLDITVTLQ
ncbi:DUF4402 domain-containing protein [Oceanibaculum pacificum]|uniref:DUF4402 domain-containing protein n=1 Tax=Oceanibaculum pacificum TaxID=580166 RepID=A0A154W332_9PROT|nr:DUF4402 domain-containing protein [Oceanibaculum pacificum]KZD07853.1 hypothetical protein AUP43_09530 [Oceanibaculum pacificum]